MTHRAEPYFEISFAPTAAALAGARDDFTRWLGEAAVDGEASDDMAVILSELGANAIDAASGGSGVMVRAGCDGHDVVLEVVNAGRSEAGARPRWALEDPLRSGGRGLVIVGALSDQLDIDHEDGRLVVRCQRRLHG